MIVWDGEDTSVIIFVVIAKGMIEKGMDREGR
jgi:hypothetical protein